MSNYALREATTSEVLSVLKAAAAVSDPGYGVWAYDEWQAHNRAYFGGELKPGGIFWGLTPHGHTLGYYEPWRNGITLHTSLLEPRSKNPWGLRKVLGEWFASDVLLHEMVHQAIQQQRGHDGGGKSCHNNPSWAAEITRISVLLGLDCRAQMVKQRRVAGKVRWVPADGCLTVEEMKHWPHSVRPAGYYERETSKLVEVKAL